MYCTLALSVLILLALHVHAKALNSLVLQSSIYGIDTLVKPECCCRVNVHPPLLL